MLRALLETKTTMLADLDESAGAGEGDRLLLRSDLGGTMQLYELEVGVGAREDGRPRQLTDLPEPVATAHYLPGTRRAVLEVDSGGNERHQLYVLDLEPALGEPVQELGGLEAITKDPRFGHHFNGFSPDGKSMAYLSNRRNGVDFDLWLYDFGAGDHRCVYESSSYCQPASGYSPDGRWVSLLQPGSRPLDVDLVLVEVHTGEVRLVLEHPEEAAVVGEPAWADEGSFFVSSNVGSDVAGIVRYDLGTAEATLLPGTGEEHDAEPIVAKVGGALVVMENRNGACAMAYHDGSGWEEEVPLAEPGVVASHGIPRPILSSDGSRLYFSLSSPRLAGDVWLFDRSTRKTRRLTRSPSEVDPADLVTPEIAETTSFDGERLPLYAFRPAKQDGPHPVVVMVHGGPEAQAMLVFNPMIQALVDAGYGVVVPNVRGSTGYGKRYAGLDDTTRRLDSVRDLAAVHTWLGANNFDAGAAVLWGGSYGGYMVLAGLAFQPELWAAGVDIVGISDLVTFLENTSEYRRAHREREYGSLAHDRAFLESASPLRKVDAMRAPLFVIHGRNDPRVPVSEAEQLVSSLRERGVRCELVIYEDEGHGLARLANRLDAYPRAIGFLDEVLRRADGPQ